MFSTIHKMPSKNPTTLLLKLGNIIGGVDTI